VLDAAETACQFLEAVEELFAAQGDRLVHQAFLPWRLSNR
jgi:hypothetical protein